MSIYIIIGEGVSNPNFSNMDREMRFILASKPYSALLNFEAWMVYGIVNAHGSCFFTINLCGKIILQL